MEAWLSKNAIISSNINVQWDISICGIFVCKVFAVVSLWLVLTTKFFNKEVLYMEFLNYMCAVLLSRCSEEAWPNVGNIYAFITTIFIMKLEGGFWRSSCVCTCTRESGNVHD